MVETPDGAAYVNRVRAEIEADAENRRRRDPELRRLERDIERAWMDVAPPGAAGDQHELLLDRADRLALIDVDAPLGERTGVRQIKGTIRKATYWYLRYVSDQLNALNNVITRLLRRLDQRMERVESALSLDGVSDLIDSVAEPSESVAAAVADAVGSGDGRVAVFWCGAGSVVNALEVAGRQAYGIDREPLMILDGVQRGLDLRTGDPVGHLEVLEDDELDAAVLMGEIENMTVAANWSLISGVSQVVKSGGSVVVAAGDPQNRDVVESELRAGRGLSPRTWAHLWERAGWTAETRQTGDTLIAQLVVARRP